MQIWLIVIFTGLRKPARPGNYSARPGPAQFLEEIFKPPRSVQMNVMTPMGSRAKPWPQMYF